MPYIAIKSYPRDKESRDRLAEKIRQDVMEICHLPASAVTIGYEEIRPEDWEETVVKAEIEPNMDKMLIVKGEKVAD